MRGNDPVVLLLPQNVRKYMEDRCAFQGALNGERMMMTMMMRVMLIMMMMMMVMMMTTVITMLIMMMVMVMVMMMMISTLSSPIRWQGGLPRLTVYRGLTGIPDASFFAVFDGHGGARAAQ
jgi:hypothetical protein